MDFLVKPRYNDSGKALYFPTGSINSFQSAEYNDKFGFYQSTFGCYSYMTLNHDNEFVIHYPKGSHMVWQTHNSCAWTPLTTLSTGSISMKPSRVKLNEQQCYDENFGSTFAAWMKWTQNPEIGFTEAGIVATNAITTTIVKNATLGARASMVAGKLFTPGSVDIEASQTPTRLEQAFEKTIGAVRGWIELAKTRSTESGKGHLNQTGLITAGNISTDGKTYTGATKSVVELYDENLAASPNGLQDAIVEGGVGGFGFDFYPLWKVSPSILRALDLEWKALKSSAVINQPRISVKTFPYQTPSGTRDIDVFMIDKTVVIPIHEVAMYEKHLTGTSHFCYLTISGVIQLGGSFGSLPVAGESDVAIMIQQGKDVEDLGTNKFLAHALMGTAINDTNYLCGAYSYAEPA